jgi:hypothetical protein
MRAEFQVRSGDPSKEAGERTVEEAESTAETAVALAFYYVNVAEWAVLDAVVARAEAGAKAEAD